MIKEKFEHVYFGATESDVLIDELIADLDRKLSSAIEKPIDNEEGDNYEENGANR